MGSTAYQYCDITVVEPIEEQPDRRQCADLPRGDRAGLHIVKIDLIKKLTASAFLPRLYFCISFCNIF